MSEISELLSALSAEDVPAIFEEYGNEQIEITGITTQTDDYGNEEIESLFITSTPIWVLRTPEIDKFTRRNEGEYGRDRFLIPYFWEGEKVVIKQNYQLKRLANDIHDEAVFAVEEIRESLGYYEVIATINRNE